MSLPNSLLEKQKKAMEEAMNMYRRSQGNPPVSSPFQRKDLGSLKEVSSSYVASPPYDREKGGAQQPQKPIDNPTPFNESNFSTHFTPKEVDSTLQEITSIPTLREKNRGSSSKEPLQIVEDRESKGIDLIQYPTVNQEFIPKHSLPKESPMTTYGHLASPEQKSPSFSVSLDPQQYHQLFTPEEYEKQGGPHTPLDQNTVLDTMIEKVIPKSEEDHTPQNSLPHQDVEPSSHQVQAPLDTTLGEVEVSQSQGVEQNHFNTLTPTLEKITSHGLEEDLGKEYGAHVDRITKNSLHHLQEAETNHEKEPYRKK